MAPVQGRLILPGHGGAVLLLIRGQKKKQKTYSNRTDEEPLMNQNTLKTTNANPENSKNTENMGKKAASNLDLTSGEPMRLLILFAIPMLIGSVFQLLYNMVDSIILGKFISAQAFASVGATSSTTAFVMMICNALVGTFTIQVSQAYGAKEEGKVRHIVGQSAMLTAFFGILVGAIMLLTAAPLMRLLDTPSDIFDGSVTYIQITCGLFLAQIAYKACAGVLRAIGDSRTPLMFLIVCSLMNIVLDLLFAVRMGHGVAGVAWATVLAQVISAVLCFAYMWKKYPTLHFSARDLIPDTDVLKPFAAIAAPMCFQNSMLTIGMMVITRVINSFGSDIVAAYTLGSRVEQLVTVIFSQVAFSFSVYSGQNYGAKLPDRITNGFRDAVKLLSVLVAIAMFIMLTFGRYLALLFINADETAILEAGVKMIRIEGVFLPALCAIWLFNSALRGMGKIRPTIISSIIELGAKIGFSIILSAIMGYVGIWLAAPIGWVLGIIPGAIYFLNGSWKDETLR